MSIYAWLTCMLTKIYFYTGHNPSFIFEGGIFWTGSSCKKNLTIVEGNLDLNLSENASEVLTAAKIIVKDSKCQKSPAICISFCPVCNSDTMWSWIILL